MSAGTESNATTLAAQTIPTVPTVPAAREARGHDRDRRGVAVARSCP